MPPKGMILVPDELKRSKSVATRLNQDEFEQVKRLAAKDRRSLCDWVRKILMEHVESLETATEKEM